MIVAPRVIRPGQVVQVSITILKLYHTHINVRGSIRMGSEEFASFNERFTSPSTRTTQMQVCFFFVVISLLHTNNDVQLLNYCMIQEYISTTVRKTIWTYMCRECHQKNYQNGKS